MSNPLLLAIAAMLFSQSLLADFALGNAKRCQDYSGVPPAWQEQARAGMVQISGGEFIFGTHLGYAEERLEVKTKVNAFWIDQTEVTVAQFADFVHATSYVTDAEREGGAVVFRIPQPEQLKQIAYPWWVYQKGADWRHPQGPNSTAQANYPVTQVTLDDAKAYAHWLGRDLPTEAEWEYAAKAGGQDRHIEQEPRDAANKPRANFWQGQFPLENTEEDGFAGVAPVGCYPANAFGVFDMIGNVWEQTRDVYTPAHALFAKPAATTITPKSDQSMVIKGGLHLCAQNYCVRYRPSAREAHEANLPIAHIGFRTVWREPETDHWFWSWRN